MDFVESGRKYGRLRAAQQLGMSIDDYLSMLESGKKWCIYCRTWQSVDIFIRDKSRTDGRGTRCLNCRRDYNIRRWEDVKNSPHLIDRKRTRERLRGKRRDSITVPKRVRDDRWDEYEGMCAYCGKPAGSWDHVVPVSKGGKTVAWNIVPACLSCNSSKCASDVFEWLDRKGYLGCWQLWDQLSGSLTCPISM